MALVFPGFMMMQMLSAGAIGGGISSAIARALGSGRREDADAFVMHAVIINVALGLLFSAVFIVFGPQLYRAMGGEGASLQAALNYSNVVFAGAVLVWLLTALASVLRGTGNMLVPSIAICVGVVLLIPLSPLLIFGLGPVPALGIAGGGIAVAGYGTGARLEYLLIPLVFGQGGPLALAVAGRILAPDHRDWRRMVRAASHRFPELALCGADAGSRRLRRHHHGSNRFGRLVSPGWFCERARRLTIAPVNRSNASFD